MGIDKMRDEGWDDPEDWQEITDDELQKHIGFSRGHIKKWHRKFNEWNKIDANKKEAEELERQRKMQLKSAQDAEDKERRRIMQQEQDKIEAMRKEMEREKKALELERQKKEKRRRR